ncbi:MAG: hypothetical protein R3C44_14660 [Chloroflexota bacterium]
MQTTSNSSFSHLLIISLIVLLAAFVLGLTAASLRAATFTAGTEAELVIALNDANGAGAGSHVISLTADITLTAPLPQVNNPAADGITIAGDGHTLTGDGVIQSWQLPQTPTQHSNNSPSPVAPAVADKAQPAVAPYSTRGR